MSEIPKPTHNASLVPSRYVAVTKSDSTATWFNGIYIGTAGDVAIKGVDGVAVTFKNAPAGLIIPGFICAVMSTNTTASDIVGFVP